MRGRKAGVENSSKCLYYTAVKTERAQNNTSLRLEKEIRTRTEKKMEIEGEM
jgi:hypothetical protein